MRRRRPQHGISSPKADDAESTVVAGDTLLDSEGSDDTAPPAGELEPTPGDTLSGPGDTDPPGTPDLSSVTAGSDLQGILGGAVEDEEEEEPEPEEPTTQLGQLLVGEQLVSHEQLADALLAQSSTGKRIGALLVEQGALDERALARTLATQRHLDYADLARRPPTPEALATLPEEDARARFVIPVAIEDGTVTIAVADPDQASARDLAKEVGSKVRLVVAAPSDIRQSIDGSYRALRGLDEYVSAFEGTGIGIREESIEQVFTEAAPVVRVVDMLVTQAARDGASDIHIEPQDDRTRVRFRVDGDLHDAAQLPASMGPSLVSRLKILADLNIAERRRSQDGKITMHIDDRDVDLRVSTMATIWGEKCVVRLLDKGRALLRMGELGMPGDTHAKLSALVRAPFGMVVCAGPTGSGKTTTMYAVLSEIDEPRRNITTIEDPVEYVFPSMNQVQINEQAGVTFADGLKSILRQDPDIIMVGEVRDVETARIAVQSAMTGHFVLSSLHATDSASALHRFLDMGIESFLVASSVSGILSQRLVLRVCEACKAPYEPSADERAFFEEGAGEPKETFWKGQGCTFCSGTGYRGRVGVFELLRMTPELRRLLVGWATQEELHRTAVSQGMRTLKQEALRLVSRDMTTIAEVMRCLYGS